MSDWERQMSRLAAERRTVDEAEGITREAVDGPVAEAAYLAELAAVATADLPPCLSVPCARANGHQGWHTNGHDGEGSVIWA